MSKTVMQALDEAYKDMARSERHVRKALKIAQRVTDAIEEMKCDADEEVYEALLAIQDELLELV